MSDILNRQIAERMKGPQIDIASTMTDAEVRDAYDVVLYNLTRLSSAISILFPDEQKPGEGSVDCAIRLLEEAVTVAQWPG